jgi:putative transposase
MTGLFILRGVPAYIRSDNRPKFIAEAVWGWTKAVEETTAYIAPGSPKKNGYRESATGECAPLMDVIMHCRIVGEFPTGEIFHSLRKAKIMIEGRRHQTT